MGTEQTIAHPESDVVAQTPTQAGRRFRSRDHYVVGREKVREFARAVQAQHGAHLREPDARKLGYDGIIAPPTFSSVIGITATRALLDSVLTEYDLSQILQTDQVFEIVRPILAGDRLTTEIVIESIRQFGDNDFILVGFALTDQHGAVVQTGSTTIVARRGVEVDANIAETVESIVMHAVPLTTPRRPRAHSSPSTPTTTTSLPASRRRARSCSACPTSTSCRSAISSRPVAPR